MDTFAIANGWTLIYYFINMLNRHGEEGLSATFHIQAASGRGALVKEDVHQSRSAKTCEGDFPRWLPRRSAAFVPWSNAAYGLLQAKNLENAVILAKNPRLEMERFLANLEEGVNASKYKKDQVIFAQGSNANAVFFVQSGRVRLTVVSSRGKEAVVGILEAGAFFGEGCLTGQARRISTATTMTACSIIRIEKPAMARVLGGKPEFAEGFLSYVLARNARVEEDLVDQLLNSSEKRLARALLLLAQFGKDGRSEPVPKISQETLAQIVGTTRGRVSLFMNRFRRLGFIEYDGDLTVHSSLLSVLLSD